MDRCTIQVIVSDVMCYTVHVVCILFYKYLTSWKGCGMWIRPILCGKRPTGREPEKVNSMV